MKPDLILASSSASRQMLMRNAGLNFSAEPADIDERAIDAQLEKDGATPDRIAVELAKAKALAISNVKRDTVVLGCDQTMSLGSRIYHKAKNKAEAHANLMSLSGKTHRLNCGAALAKDSKILWEVATIAELTVRKLTDDFVDRYLERVGAQVFSSVGSYQLEGEGIQLFNKIEGDYFTILGLPLLPLLMKLRELDMIDG